MRRSASFAALLACLAAVALARVALAEDVIVLENGARISGHIVAEDAKSVTLERSLGGGRTRMTLTRDRIKSIERDPTPPPGAPPPPAAADRAAAGRDAWFLLQSGGQVVGTRHLLVIPMPPPSPGEEGGWRIEEQVRLFPTSRLPGVRVQRIEDLDASFLPRSLHYREVGDPGTGTAESSAYETLRQGPVEAGVWKLSEHEAGKACDRTVSIPAGGTSPLAAREALVRAVPRTAGLRAIVVVDPATATRRTVRAGFSSLGGASTPGGEPEDVLRWEDGDVAFESKWAPLASGAQARASEPPRCLSEQVAPGVTAVAATPAQAEAAEAKASADAPARELAIADVGLSLALPGASWTGEALPSRPGDDGVRLVGKIQSRQLASDVRVEWDPRAAAATSSSVTAAAAEAALLARLRVLAPDVAVVKSRAAVEALPGAWRMTLEGTVRGERVRTLVLVAERGEGRATLLASCAASAWKDAEAALEAIVGSFRWL